MEGVHFQSIQVVYAFNLKYIQFESEYYQEKIEETEVNGDLFFFFFINTLHRGEIVSGFR